MEKPLNLRQAYFVPSPSLWLIDAKDYQMFIHLHSTYLSNVQSFPILNVHQIDIPIPNGPYARQSIQQAIQANDPDFIMLIKIMHNIMTPMADIW